MNLEKIFAEAGRQKLSQIRRHLTAQGTIASGAL
jgi:hypothetical protein